MHSSNFKNYITPAIVVSIIIVAFFVGFMSGQAHMAEASKVQVLEASLGADKANASSTANFELFWKVWGLLDDKFVRTKVASSTTNEDRVYGAIKGMVESMGDPYTTFFTPAAATQFETQIEGNFQGVGMEMGIKDDVLTVISAIKGSPAEAAGIKSGDKVVKIDTTSTENLPIDEAVKLIRGKKGTTVLLTIVRQGVDKPLEIKVTRDVINIPTLNTKYDQKSNIFTISLYNFSADSASAFRGALRDFVNSKSDKLIIDLRGNPGGFLDAAVDMASWFLPPGVPVVKEDYGGKQPDLVEKSLGYNIFSDKLRMVILVDGGSASAAEILAGALSEYGKAKLVGMKTFGKGSVQEYIKVSPDTALKVTVARWLTPNGKSISEEGLAPDYVVDFTEADAKAGTDPQMAKAVELLSN